MTGGDPRIELLAAPNADALAGLESSLLTPRHVDALVAAPVPSPDQQRHAVQDWVQAAVSDLWPGAVVADPPLIDIGTAVDGPLTIRVVHFGGPLSADTLKTLWPTLNTSLRREAARVDVAVPAFPHPTGRRPDIRCPCLRRSESHRRTSERQRLRRAAGHDNGSARTDQGALVRWLGTKSCWSVEPVAVPFCNKATGALYGIWSRGKDVWGNGECSTVYHYRSR